MALRREEKDRQAAERGDITVMYRPRLKTDDVQRLLLVLCPDGQDRFRVVVIGRRSLDRFWGFVDLVLYSPQDLRAVLEAQTLVQDGRDVRQIPAAVPVTSGRYELSWLDGNAHLHYELEGVRSDYMVTVANPEPGVWGLSDSPPLQSDLFDEDEVHVTVPSPLPPRLQQRFGNRRVAPLDADFLDHPGAELIFVQRTMTDRLSAAT